MKILHIINKLNDVYAWQAVYRQKRKEENTIEVLLLHDAVYSQVQEEVEVMASKDDVLGKRGGDSEASCRLRGNCEDGAGL